MHAAKDIQVAMPAGPDWSTRPQTRGASCCLILMEALVTMLRVYIKTTHELVHACMHVEDRSLQWDSVEFEIFGFVNLNGKAGINLFDLLSLFGVMSQHIHDMRGTSTDDTPVPGLLRSQRRTRKCSRDHSSSSLLWTGVPVSSSLCLILYVRSAWLSWQSAFLMRCPSSRMRYAHFIAVNRAASFLLIK